MTIRFPDGRIRMLVRDDIVRILGIVSGTERVVIGRPVDKLGLVVRARRVLHLRASSAKGITVDDLLQELITSNPASTCPAEKRATTSAYVLLVIVTIIAPRQSKFFVPEDLLALIVAPGDIGRYDWAGFVLEHIKAAAEKLQMQMKTKVSYHVLGGCNLLVQVVPA